MSGRLPRSARSIRPPPGGGFTLVEMMVTVVIAAVIAALAWSSLERTHPRARLADGGSQLQALLHAARQQAIASGHDVVVMFFPQYSAGSGQLGRVVAVEDARGDFLLSSGAPNFGSYTPDRPGYGTGGQLLNTLDLPSSVVFGPATGLGTATLPAPFDGVDVSKSCSFCQTGGDGRGAIRFDERGRAWFYNGNSAALTVTTGGSVSITQSDLGSTTTLVVTSGTGAAMVFTNG